VGPSPAGSRASQPTAEAQANQHHQIFGDDFDRQFASSAGADAKFVTDLSHCKRAELPHRFCVEINENLITARPQIGFVDELKNDASHQKKSRHWIRKRRLRQGVSERGRGLTARTPKLRPFPVTSSNGPPGRDGKIRILDLLEKLRQQFRSVLEIGIHDSEHAAAGVTKTTKHGRSQAAALASPNDAQPGIKFLEFLSQRPGLIGRIVIGNNDFETNAGERIIDPGKKFRQVFALVVCRQDQAKIDRCIARPVQRAVPIGRDKAVRQSEMQSGAEHAEALEHRTCQMLLDQLCGVQQLKTDGIVNLSMHEIAPVLEQIDGT